MQVRIKRKNGSATHFGKGTLLFLPLALLLPLSACAKQTAETPFALLNTRVAEVCQLPDAEREAFYAQHYGELLEAGQVAFPEDYLLLSDEQKAEEWRASLDTVADYEAAMLGGTFANMLAGIAQNSIPVNISSGGITVAELACWEGSTATELYFGVFAKDVDLTSLATSLTVDGAPCSCERLTIGIGAFDTRLNPPEYAIFRAQWDGAPAGESQIAFTIGDAVFALVCDWDAQRVRDAR